MSDKSVMPILQRLRSMMPVLRQQFPIGHMALFGSVARGDAGPDSDIDILVDVDPSIGLRFVSLAERLEAELGRKVDLVSRRALKPAFLEQIQHELIHVEA